MKAIIIARVSTEEQKEQVFSLRKPHFNLTKIFSPVIDVFQNTPIIEQTKERLRRIKELEKV